MRKYPNSITPDVSKEWLDSMMKRVRESKNRDGAHLPIPPPQLIEDPATGKLVIKNNVVRRGKHSGRRAPFKGYTVGPLIDAVYTGLKERGLVSSKNRFYRYWCVRSLAYYYTVKKQDTNPSMESLFLLYWRLKVHNVYPEYALVEKELYARAKQIADRECEPCVNIDPFGGRGPPA